jgi:hypothetical protein
MFGLIGSDALPIYVSKILKSAKLTDLPVEPLLLVAGELIE